MLITFTLVLVYLLASHWLSKAFGFWLGRVFIPLAVVSVIVGGVL